MGSAIGVKSQQGSRTGRCGWITSFLRSVFSVVHRHSSDAIETHLVGALVGLSATDLEGRRDSVPLLDDVAAGLSSSLPF